MRKRPPGFRKFAINEIRESLWSRWGILVYAWLIFAVLDFSQGKRMVGFLEVYIAFLNFVIALQIRLHTTQDKLTTELLELAQHQNDTILTASKTLKKINKKIVKK